MVRRNFFGGRVSDVQGRHLNTAAGEIEKEGFIWGDRPV
jgi:hypothetical protein